MNTSSEKRAQADLAVRKKDFSFFSDVLKLVSGNSFVQVFKILVSPVISRLFLPEFLGDTQNFSSIANTLAIVSSLRYDQTILLPKEEDKAANQLAISVLATAITTSIFIFFVWFFRTDIANLLNSPTLDTFLWFVPLYAAALGIFNALIQWNSRKRKFLRLSAAQVSSEVIGDGLTIGFGVADLASSSTMILSRIAGQAVATLTLGTLILKEDGKVIFNNLKWQEMRSGLKTFKKFPLYNMWASLLSNASLYLPPVLLSGYFSPTIAGYFSLGHSVLRLPVALVANSIGQVFFQRSAKAIHTGRLAQTVEETFKRLVIFGLFPMLVVAVSGKELFSLVFGAVWKEAGIYSQILSIWTFFIFLVSPLSNLTNILGRNEVSVIINLIRLATGIGSLVIGGLLGNPQVGLWCFSISGSVTFLAFTLWATNACGLSISKTLRIFFKTIIFSIPFIGIILLYKYWNPVADMPFSTLGFSLSDIVLALVCIVATFAYYAVAFWKDTTLKEAAVNTFSHLFGKVK